MKIDAKKFAFALEKVVRIASRRTTSPVLNCVKLEAAWGLLSINATDWECHAVSKCECEGDLETLCVNANTLLGLVKFSSGEMTLDLIGSKLLVSNGSKINLSVLPGSDFPTWPSAKMKKVGVPIKEIADGIKKVSWAVTGQSSIDPWTTAVRVVSEPNLIRCLATDGKTFAQISFPVISARCAVNIDISKIPIACEAISHPDCVISLGDSHVAFESETFGVCIKLSEAKYPKVEYLISLARSPAGEYSVPEMVSALSTIILIAKDKAFCATTMTRQQKSLRIEFADPENDFMRDIEFTGDMDLDSSFRIDARLALKAFESVPALRCLISINHNSLKISAGDYIAMVALLDNNKTNK